MEENNVIKTEKKGSYLTGIIGAIIGGAIATIPWVLVYIYGNMMLSLLAIIIALGALKGYQICKGKMTKAVKPIVAIISLVVVVFATLIVIPNFLAIKEDVDINYLYDSDEFFGAIMQDLAVSVVFAILGISVAMSYIDKILMENTDTKEDAEILQKQEELLKAQVDKKLKEKDKKNVELAREAFSKLNAFTKETAVEKEKIISEMNSPEAEKIFNQFKKKNVIIKYKEKYYYDKSKEMLLTNNYWVSFICIIIVVSICAAFMNMDSSSNKNKNNNLNQILGTSVSRTICNKTIKMDLPQNLKEEKTDYETTTYLYSEDGEVSITIVSTAKAELAELGDYTLADYKDDMKAYVHSIYETEDETEYKEIKAGKYNGYSNEFNTVEEGARIHANTYLIETDNYFVEIYAFTFRSKAKQYQDIFNKMINSIEEEK